MTVGELLEALSYYDPSLEVKLEDWNEQYNSPAPLGRVILETDNDVKYVLLDIA